MFEVNIEREGQPVRTVRVKAGVFHIGRGETCELQLDDKEVSRRHARLLVEGPLAVIEDLGSGNGTFVGDEKVSARPLQAGDVIEIVPFTLTVRPVEEAVAAPPAVLEIIDGPGTGQRFELRGTLLSVGRGDDQRVRLPDQGASRSHATLLQQQGGWFVKDHGSANGTLVNGERVTETRLAAGDVLVIGNTRLRYEPPATGAAPSAALPAAAPRRAAPAPEAAAGGTSAPLMLAVGLGAVVVLGLAVVLLFLQGGA